MSHGEQDVPPSAVISTGEGAPMRDGGGSQPRQPRSDPTTSRGRAALLTGPFLLAAAANFAHNFAYHSYLHLPGRLSELGADELVIGLVVGTLSLTAVVTRPAAGWLMDQRGRRTTFLIGGGLHLLACLSYFLVDAIGPLLFAVRVLHGLAISLVLPAFFTWVVDIVPRERRTEGIALFGVSGLLPLSLGPWAGDHLLAGGDYRRLFAVTAACALIGIVLSVPLVDTRAGLEAGTARRGYLATLTMPELRPVWFIGASFAAALAGYFAFVKTYVLAVHIDGVGGFFSAYAWSAIAVRVLAGRLSERVGARPLLLASLLVMSGSLAVTSITGTAQGLMIAGAMCGLGHGYAFPLLSTLVVERAPVSERGTAIALFTALFELGILIGAPLLGLVARAADYDVMYAVAAVGLLGATVVFGAWDRPAAPRR